MTSVWFQAGCGGGQHEFGVEVHLLGKLALPVGVGEHDPLPSPGPHEGADGEAHPHTRCRIVGLATTTMSRNGQVVITKAVRDQLGLRPGQKFVITTFRGGIVLQPVPESIFELQGAMAGAFGGDVEGFKRGLRADWEGRP